MSETTRPAPYPADTKAKGWRFELDYERIEQSGSWALAAKAGQEGRPLLLMLWLVAWRQEPCGTLPADEEVISALIGINDKTWAKYRKVLMRGWWKAEDGLLYHPTITARVLEMIDYRKKTAERVAKHKLAKREQRDGNALPTEEATVKNDTGTGTGTINTPPPPYAHAESDDPRPEPPAPEDLEPPQLRGRFAPDSCEVFPIELGWQPGPAFSVQAKALALPVLSADDMRDGTSEFVAFWMARPHEVRTQAEWENALAKRLKQTCVQAASVAHRAAQHRRQSAPVNTPNHGAYDVVERA